MLDLNKQNEQFPHLTNLEVQLYSKNSRYSWLSSTEMKMLLENKKLQLLDTIDPTDCILRIRQQFKDKTWIILRANDLF